MSSIRTVPALPVLAEQAERLIDLGVPALAGIGADVIRSYAAEHDASGLLAVHPDRLPGSAIAHLMRRGDKAGFIVTDMPDVDEFSPIVDVPDAPLYVVSDPDRGDHLANWSPAEALPELTGVGRTPLLLTEGIGWVLQQPEALERNRCFMTIGSRLRKPDGAFDSRTPAIWISNGTGRDGKDRRDAPKVGWCWWGNRHTWLGFASGAARSA
ncbi:DUF5701 family protein [Tsukamurella sp. PLM1]|uniref:DUF5701 family protein n=1 Tax=Tsukamurella sp. PLM1 TaxID=2929795 RepID=UPI0020C082C2|nr:DUF5701 family protein [Tsukamurella sp. PLM1]